MNYETIKVLRKDSICFIQMDRPSANNTINDRLVLECNHALAECEESATVVILSGSPEVFCMGADFSELGAVSSEFTERAERPGALYDLWLRLSNGPYVSVAHVRGKANAGGIGFVAACDIAIADETALFSLSELLFGLYPACVLPFLVRRVGVQKAHYLTLTTQPITAQVAHSWGLVDAVEPDSEASLRRHLLRLRRLSKTAIKRYKQYMNRITESIADTKSLAVAGNLEVFSDPRNLEGIARYAQHGIFPWEKA